MNRFLFYLSLLIFCFSCEYAFAGGGKKKIGASLPVEEEIIRSGKRVKRETDMGSFSGMTKDCCLEVLSFLSMRDLRSIGGTCYPLLVREHQELGRRLSNLTHLKLESLDQVARSLRSQMISLLQGESHLQGYAKKTIEASNLENLMTLPPLLRVALLGWHRKYVVPHDVLVLFEQEVCLDSLNPHHFTLMESFPEVLEFGFGSCQFPLISSLKTEECEWVASSKSSNYFCSKELTLPETFDPWNVKTVYFISLALKNMRENLRRDFLELVKQALVQTTENKLLLLDLLPAFYCLTVENKGDTEYFDKEFLRKMGIILASEDPFEFKVTSIQELGRETIKGKGECNDVASGLYYFY